MKKVLAITGIRSEYFILKPVISALKESGKFDVKIVVSCAHLSEWHGNTEQIIEQDGFEICDRIDSLFMTNRVTQRAKGTGVLTYALSQTVEREKPDFLLVVGDREEPLATAIVGNYMGVLTAHIGGGDPVYGNADDPIRFAVSKLAHIHFATAKQYAENIVKLGEEDFRVFRTGNPALDSIRKTPHLNWEKVLQGLDWPGLEKQKYIVFIKHPLSSEKSSSYEQMKISLKASIEFARKNNLKIVGIYPNTDPGAYDILRAIEEVKDPQIIRFFKTLHQEIFVNVLRNALALVGNSSMGILEAPFYKLPVVNIGKRQQGRLNAGQVEFVDYREEEISSAIEKACFDKEYREYVSEIENPFGDGYAGERITEILSDIGPKDKKWLVKKKLI